MSKQGRSGKEDAKDHVGDDERRNEGGERLADEELLAADRGYQDRLQRPPLALSNHRVGGQELSTRKAAVGDALEALKETRPAGHHPDEIAAMLDAVPDLRPTLKTATAEKLAEIFRAFDVRITYDKTRQVLDLAATIMPELLPDLAKRKRLPPEGRSWDNEVVEERFVPISDSDLAVPVGRTVPGWPGL
jgi:hypothetical protein